MQRTIDLRVPDFITSGIGFSTPQVLMVPTSRLRAFSRWEDFRNVPVVQKQGDVTLAMFDRQPAVRFEIFLDDDSGAAVPCDLFYEVVGPHDEQMLYARRKITIRGEGDEYVVGFNVDSWDPGTYKLNLRAVAHNPERDASATVDVRLDVTRAMLTTRFDQTMSIMEIVYDKDELEPLREAPESNRAVEWARFWNARDPDPSTPENEALQQYISRINYVTENFSRVGPGWKTDRGHVYIRYGAPDQIDTASDQRNQGRYEIWRYLDANRTFVFYDMFGVGDYKLVEGDMF
jgi:GWxTD domain-containing protein